MSQNSTGKMKLPLRLSFILGLYLIIAVYTVSLYALELTPELKAQVTASLDTETDLAKKVKFHLLLIDHHRKDSNIAGELSIRTRLRSVIKGVKEFERLYITNLHEIGKLRIDTGDFVKARSTFQQLLDEASLSDTVAKNLSLQYLSTLSARLNNKIDEEKYLAKYVITKGLTQEFYASKKGFETLLKLTGINRSNNHYSYFSNWLRIARQNGSVEDQKYVLTQWVNYTTDKRARFSEEPFNAYITFLEEQGRAEELREIRLLYAQNTASEKSKAEIYATIHQEDKRLSTDTDLGLLTFLYDYYDRNSLEAEKQDILLVLINRPDYSHRDSALRQLASISLKNQDYLQSFNAHQQLYDSFEGITSDEELLVLNNLISLARQLSKDAEFETYISIKALSRFQRITDPDRLESFTQLMNYYQSTGQYQKALDFYTRFTAAGLLSEDYPEYYQVPFKTAMTIEKSNDVVRAIELYTQSLELGFNTIGYREEFVKIAQRVLNLVELHTPGKSEFDALDRLKRIYEAGDNTIGIAKTDLIIAQKRQKTGEQHQAIEQYNLALAGYQKAGDDSQVSKILTLLTNLEVGDPNKRIDRLMELEKTQAQSGISPELIRTRVEIGNLYQLSKNQGKAKAYYLKAYLTSDPPIPDIGLEAGYFAALITSQIGNIEDSNKLLTDITEQPQSTTNGKTLSLAFQLLAKNANTAGDYQKALGYIDRAIEMKVDEVRTSLALTKTAIYISHQAYDPALALISETQDNDLTPEDQLTFYLYTAKAYLGLQNYESALENVDEGLALPLSTQYSEGVYDLYTLKTQIFGLLNKPVSAVDNQTQLIEWVTNEKARDKLADAYLLLANLYIDAGQLSNAFEANSSAFTYLAGNKLIEVKATLNLAKIHRLRNKLRESVSIFETLNQMIDTSIPEKLRAEIYYQAGYTYLQISRFNQALESFSKSESLFQNQNQTVEARQAEMARANVMMKQGNIQRAEEIFQSILSESGDDKPIQADIYASLAFLYTELGQYTKALENSEKAEQLYTQTNQKARLPEVLNARGLIFLRMNDFGQSEVLFLNALEKNKQNDNPLLDSEITNNLGGLYKTKGELKKARVQLIKTAELQKQLGFESQLALTFNNIGSVYLEEEKYDEALEFLKQSREFATRFDLKKELAVSWNNEGILFFKQQQNQKATEAFKEALELQKVLSLRVDMARTLNNLSIIASDKNDKTEAVNMVQQAIMTLSLKTLDTNAFYPNPKQDEVLAASLMKDFLQNKGAFLRDIANDNSQPSIKTKYLDASYQSFDLSINLIEALRAQIKSEESQQLLLQKNIDIFQQMIAILYELGTLTKDLTYHKKAFFYAEKSRARSFLDQLQEQAARASLSLPKDIQEKETNFKSRISQLDKNIFAELSKSKQDRQEAQIEKWQLEKTEINIQYTKLANELEEKYPAYASLRYPRVYGVEDVRMKLLDIESQCIVYFLGKDASYGWRVSTDQFEMIALPPNTDIDQLIRKYRETLINPLIFYDEYEDLDIDSTNSHLVTGLQIYRTFLKPLIGNTPDRIKNLLIIPDGVLYYLPFETVLMKMHSPQNKNYFNGREYLINRYATYYSPSTSVSGMIQTQAKQRDPLRLAARKDFIGFGDPQYAPSRDEEKSFNYNPTLKSLNFYDMPRLFGTSTEIENISAMFGESVTTFVGDDATEVAAKERILGYKYIHFATHGIMDEENPEYSGVVMNLVKGVEKQDGFLQAAEIFDLKLNSDLVVLSACETGLGKVIKGEGMVGLTRAFLYAGSPSIVVSLWTVADDSTSRLMIHFYKFLNEGLSRSEALRKAKLTLLGEEIDGDILYNDPFYWGPFILNGLSS